MRRMRFEVPGLFLAFVLMAVSTQGQTSMFTFQGRLIDNALAANGTYEMQFALYDAATSGTQIGLTVTNPAVAVTNGVFSVQLSFSPATPFASGADRWIEVSVRKAADPPGYTVLSPRQQVTSAPFAIRSQNAGSADGLSAACNLCITNAQISAVDASKVSGTLAIANGGTGSSTQNFVDLTTTQTITGAKTFSHTSNIFAGSGSGLTSLSPANISPGTANININGIAAAPAVVTSGATPSVANRTMLTLNYPTPTEITDLTGGVDGQCVVFLGMNQNVTILDAGNFNLSNNFIGGYKSLTGSTITICRSSASGLPIWYEIARSTNTAIGGLFVTKSGAGSGSVMSDISGINCGSDCNEIYELGTVVTLTATPVAGSVFAGWSGGGCSGTGTCVVTLTASVSVTATFDLITFPLTVTRNNGGSVSSAPAGISCGSDCSENYVQNTVVTLTRQTDTGGVFLGWGGACSGTGLTCDVTMDAAKSVTATFGFPVAVSKAGAGSGTVTSSPAGISCGATCGANFQTDVPVTLTAVADAGSVFTGWSGSGCTGTGSCGLAHHSSDFVTATFAPQQFTLTVAKAGTGSGLVTSSPAGISCGADCSEPYNNGTTVTLTPTTFAGTTFSGWSGGGCSGTGNCTITITAAATVTATFTLQQFSMNVSVSGTGSGVVTSSPAGINCGADCTELYDFGTSVTLTAIPNSTSTFTGWSGGGCSGTGTCVVSMTAATTVTATYTQELRTLTVTTAGDGAGTLTSNPAGINCGADCTEPYVLNTVVDVTATASGGSFFFSWSGCDSILPGNVCRVSMGSAKSITATFLGLPGPNPGVEKKNGRSRPLHEKAEMPWSDSRDAKESGNNLNGLLGERGSVKFGFPFGDLASLRW